MDKSNLMGIMTKETPQGLKKVDETEVPFEHDESIIGIWEYADFISIIDNFKPEKVSWEGEPPYLKRLEFMADGDLHAVFESDQLGIGLLTWTKDFIISKTDETCSPYTIKTIGNSVYLFFEWKSGDYSFKMKDPYFYVLKKMEVDL
jgi:bla regulator protein BlaR1